MLDSQLFRESCLIYRLSLHKSFQSIRRKGVLLFVMPNIKILKKGVFASTLCVTFPCPVLHIHLFPCITHFWTDATVAAIFIFHSQRSPLAHCSAESAPKAEKRVNFCLPVTVSLYFSRLCWFTRTVDGKVGEWVESVGSQWQRTFVLRTMGKVPEKSYGQQTAYYLKHVLRKIILEWPQGFCPMIKS